jgi:hypothetical protein
MLAWIFLACTGTPADDSPDDSTAGAVENVLVNEFMAANSSTIETDSGAFSDWIELMNIGEETVHLAGWTITDDLSVPTKHVLLSQTIEPGGFLLLWADDDEEDEGTGHLGFHLDVQGESIGLYRPDGTASDTLEYDTQVEDVSSARIPDASSNWVITDEPTPGTSNGS